MAGPAGSPWTAEGILPSGATETGTWSVGRSTAAGEMYVPISFAVRLAAPLAFTGDSSTNHVHLVFMNEGHWVEVIEEGGTPIEFGTPAHCHGTAEEPKADSGHLCVYVGQASANVSEPSVITGQTIFKPFGDALTNKGAGTTGARIVTEFTGANGFRTGTFAVTG